MLCTAADIRNVSWEIFIQFVATFAFVTSKRSFDTTISFRLILYFIRRRTIAAEFMRSAFRTEHIVRRFGIRIVENRWNFRRYRRRVYVERRDFVLYFFFIWRIFIDDPIADSPRKKVKLMTWSVVCSRLAKINLGSVLFWSCRIEKSERLMCFFVPKKFWWKNKG